MCVCLWACASAPINIHVCLYVCACVVCVYSGVCMCVCTHKPCATCWYLNMPARPTSLS